MKGIGGICCLAYNILCPDWICLVTSQFTELFYCERAHIAHIAHIVSWGNFGHGATSVKKSLRNHFGRINNV